MAPKRTAVKAAAKKAAAKKATEGTAMDKGEVSRMLSMLKYNSSAGSKGSDDWKKQCRDALGVYGRLKGESKHTFLKQWARNKRDLTWVSTMEEVEEELSEVEDGETRGFFLVEEIFALSSLPMQQMTQKQAEETLKDLLDESSELFGHDPECIVHKNPRLTKYKYVKKAPVLHKNRSVHRMSKKDKISGDTAKFQDAIGAATGASSSSADGVAVKVENPELLKLRSMIVTLRSGKKALSTVLESVRDISSAVENLPAEALARIGPNRGLELIVKMETHMATIRTTIAVMEGITKTEGIEENMAKIQTCIDETLGHVDGGKILAKNLKKHLA